jgi:chitinase
MNTIFSKVNTTAMRLLLMLVVLLIGGTNCFASTITLKWDPVDADDLAGYKVYYSTTLTTPFTGTGAAQGASPVKLSTQPSATITGLDPDQGYYFAITAFNNAGVESPYSAIVTVPELVPPTVTLTSPAHDTRVTGTVSVAASAADNIGVARVEFYVDGVLKSSDTGTPYLFSWDTAALASGSHTLFAKAYDAAGNVGQSESVSVQVVHDTVAPTVGLAAPGNGATVHGTLAVTANATDDIGVTKVELYANGALLFAGNLPPYSYSWDTTVLANGAYALSARAYDAAGHVSQSAEVQVSVLNDFTPPVVTLDAPAGGSTVAGTRTVSATASDDVAVTRVEFYINNVLASTSSAAPFSFAWDTSELAAGFYTLSARAYDAAGNVGQSPDLPAEVAAVQDGAPVVTILAPAAHATANGRVLMSAGASADEGVSRVDFYLNGALLYSASDAPYVFYWDTLDFPNGEYSVTAVAFDAAGHSGKSAAVPVTVANKPGQLVLFSLSPAPGSKKGESWMVSASPSSREGIAKVEFYVNDTLVTSLSSAPYKIRWNTAGLPSGTYVLSAKSYDSVGNVGESSRFSLSLSRDVKAPVVAIAAPASLAKLSGTVAVNAQASDNVGVARVEFYANGTLIATRTSAPFGFSWNTAAFANGSYALSAKAYDAAGNVGQSAATAVTVANGGISTASL